MTPRTDWSARFASAGSDAMREDYDGVLVPRLFVPWAKLLADQLELTAGESVLDVACGPGTVARIAAQRVGPGGRVVGVDFSPSMLVVARDKPPVAGGAPLEYRQAPADELPVPDGDFDVVTCQHGLQFFPDRPAALAEMRRVLRRGGRLGVAVWCSIAECPAFDALADGIAEVLGNQLATMYRAGPWAIPDADDVMSLVDRAGFADLTVARYELPLVFEGGAAQLVDSLSATAVATEVAALDQAGRQKLVDAVDRAAAPLLDGHIVRSTAAAHVVLARA